MLSYKKIGQGPSVVLLHGYPFHHKIWIDLVEKLSDRFTFILPDAPGLGSTPEWTNNFSLKDIAQSIAEIIEKEHIDKTIIAGHSMGGYISMAFAKMFPEKLKAISLIHTTTAADSEERIKVRLKSIDMIEKGGEFKEAYIKTMINSLFNSVFLNTHQESVRIVKEMAMEASSNTLIALLNAMKNREDTTDFLKEINIPVQWILGEKDTVAPYAETLPKTLLTPGLTDICIYKDCGHMSMQENTEQLHHDLEKFWATIYEL